MESTPLVSVVTPFYNTADYLAECIESVLRQTYTNFEYILLNNSSTDGSRDIAQQYATQVPDKIRVFDTKSFLTQVQNYNYALSLISPQSKYCKMVQADDWIFPECLKSMVELAEAHPNVAIVSAYELEGNRAFLGDGLPYPSSEVPGREICRAYFTKYIHVFGTPTSLMMRSDLVRSRNPSFYDERHAPFEDHTVCFDLLRAGNLGFVHQVLTYSRRDNESILSRIRPYRFELFTRLAFVVAYARDFLSEDEYAWYLNDAERKYFYFLGRSAWEGRDVKFWEFHRGRLASINYSMNSRFMAKWILIVLLDDLGNPKRTLEYLWPRRKRIFSVIFRLLDTFHRNFARKPQAPSPHAW